MVHLHKKVFLIILIVSGILSQDYALRFDGDGDYVLIPDHPDLDLTENYTLEAWIFPESFSWLAGILSKYHTNASNGYLLRLTNQSPYDGLSFDEVVTNVGILNSNQWYHIAAVNEFGERKLYLNGTEYFLSGNPLNVSVNSDPIRIGSDFGGRFFEGRIDEIRIWDVPRSQTDILSTLDSNLSGSEYGLIAYYTFNEGFGDTLFDQTGQGHDGILMGYPSWGDGFTMSGLLGDINFDAQLNIYDAVMLVAIILNLEEGTNLQIYVSDTNQDGIIDIDDIVLLIQWILNIDGNTRIPIQHAGYYFKDDFIVIVSDGEIAGFQIDLFEPVELSPDYLPSGWVWKQVENKIIAYSTDGRSLPQDVIFPIDKTVKIKSIKVADWSRNSVQLQQRILPVTFQLQTFPNPFNPGTKILYNLESQATITIDVYDIKGHHVSKIIEKDSDAGSHQIYWEPDHLSSGPYFLQITDGLETQTIKILLMK